jgi:hypothetical protein
MVALAIREPKPPQKLDANVPAALSELVMRLLAKDRRPLASWMPISALVRFPAEFLQ